MIRKYEPPITCPVCSMSLSKKGLPMHYKYRHPNEKLPNDSPPHIVITELNEDKSKGGAQSPEKPIINEPVAEVAPIVAKVEETKEQPTIAQPSCTTCTELNEWIAKNITQQEHTEGALKTLEELWNDFNIVVDDYRKLCIEHEILQCDKESLQNSNIELQAELETTQARLEKFESLVNELSMRYDLEKQISLIWKML